MGRRDRWSIACSILLAIERQWRDRGDAARVTNVAVEANVPYDRLQAYLADLADAGLVSQERMPRLTERGRELLLEYTRWIDILQRYGIDNPPAPRAAEELPEPEILPAAPPPATHEPSPAPRPRPRPAPWD
ncbi:MAG: winged helix-turn-helix domain-containing protein [Methanobacteriota archaeon]